MLDVLPREASSRFYFISFVVNTSSAEKFIPAKVFQGSGHGL
jgi:hypothetical protein